MPFCACSQTKVAVTTEAVTDCRRGVRSTENRTGTYESYTARHLKKMQRGKCLTALCKRISCGPDNTPHCAERIQRAAVRGRVCEWECTCAESDFLCSVKTSPANRPNWLFALSKHWKFTAYTEDNSDLLNFQRLLKIPRFICVSA